MRYRVAWLTCVCVPISVGLGCSEPMPEFGQVTGVVSANGRPLPNVIVTFLPDPTKGNDWPINASSQTDDQGKYELRVWV